MIHKNSEEKLLDAGYENIIIFKNYSFDDALIGVTTDERAVYDYDLMLYWLMETEKFTFEEAIEWLDSTIRFLPYSGDYGPIIMYKLESDDY